MKGSDVQDALAEIGVQLEGPDQYAQIAAKLTGEADAIALDRINHILSDPEWGVGMLEDICAIVRGTGRVDVSEGRPTWDRH